MGPVAPRSAVSGKLISKPEESWLSLAICAPAKITLPVGTGDALARLAAELPRTVPTRRALVVAMLGTMSETLVW